MHKTAQIHVYCINIAYICTGAALVKIYVRPLYSPVFPVNAYGHPLENYAKMCKSSQLHVKMLCNMTLA